MDKLPEKASQKNARKTTTKRIGKNKHILTKNFICGGFLHLSHAGNYRKSMFEGCTFT